jgi:hypothetical protein
MVDALAKVAYPSVETLRLFTYVGPAHEWVEVTIRHDQPLLASIILNVQVYIQATLFILVWILQGIL